VSRPVIRRLLGLAIAGLLLLAPLAPAHAGGGHWHGGVFIGVGPWWGPWGWPYPYWGYPYWGYPYYPYYYPPTVVIQEPPVYIEQTPPAPPPPPAPPAPPAYWYYCRPAQAYYPSVQTCPEEWVKVPPRQ